MTIRVLIADDQSMVRAASECCSPANKTWKSSPEQATDWKRWPWRPGLTRP